LSNNNHISYDYYLNMQDRKIYSTAGIEETDYTVDGHFNIFSTDGSTNSNLFFQSSPFKVQRTSYVYLVKSTDGGENWSEPTLINLKQTRENGLYVSPGRGMYTEDGTIIFPCYGFTTSGAEYTCFLYSTDQGNTWKRAEDMWTGTGSQFYTSESAVVELPGGRLRFFYRDRRTNITLRYADAIPSGEGENRIYTWTPEGVTENKINVDCQMSAITYSETIDGKQVILVSCPTGPGRNGSHDNNGGSTGGRKNGSLFVGLVDHEDSNYAITWLGDMYVNENDAQYMYSCLTEMADGNIALLYEDNQQGWGAGDAQDNYYFSIAYRTFKIADIVKAANSAKSIDNKLLDASLTKAAQHTAEQYTTSTYAALEDALNKANAAKGEEYDKITLENHAKTVEEAIAKLKKRGDITEAETLLKEVESLDSSLYTTESVAALTKAKEDLQLAVKDNSDIDEATMKTLVDALKTAKNKLEKISETDPGENQKPETNPGENQKPETNPGEGQKPETNPGEGQKPETNPGENQKPESVQGTIQVPKMEQNAFGEYHGEAEVQAADQKVYKLVSQTLQTETKAKVDKVLIEDPAVKAAFLSIADKNRVFLELHVKDIVGGQETKPTASVTFIVDYPRGSIRENEFEILHLVDGVTPKLLREGVDYVKQADGLHITVTSFSPFVIGWKDVSSQSTLQVPGFVAFPSTQIAAGVSSQQILAKSPLTKTVEASSEEPQQAPTAFFVLLSVGCLSVLLSYGFRKKRDRA
ncbi:MAG: exo-alpha-sialidase, partial [Roseburia sp.]